MTDCSIKTLDIDDTVRLLFINGFGRRIVNCILTNCGGCSAQAEIDLRATDIPSNIIMKSAWLAEVTHL